MEDKVCVTIAFTLLLLPLLSQALPSEPFKFLENLQGCYTGDTVKGIHQLKQYMKRFGYLDNYHQSSNVDDDDNLDDSLATAIKGYQVNYNLKPTGILDSVTVKKMIAPRCGVADIVNGTTRMRTGKKTHLTYAFFNGSPRWPDSKTHLTYTFFPNGQVDILRPNCERAFARWASVTRFTFEEVQGPADLTLGFFTGDHGDGDPFDGRGGELAHAFSPTDGRLHFDWDETWSTGAAENAFDLATVALHEIGHLLGLEHSSVEEAIMFPIIPNGATKDLNEDDIQGIHVLYNLI